MSRYVDHRILALRRQVAAEIVRSLGGSQSQFLVAPSYGIEQARMSELCRGRVERVSLEWLIRRVHGLGGTVTIDATLGDALREWQRVRFARMRARRSGGANGGAGGGG